MKSNYIIVWVVVKQQTIQTLNSSSMCVLCGVFFYVRSKLFNTKKNTTPKTAIFILHFKFDIHFLSPSIYEYIRVKKSQKQKLLTIMLC